MLEIIKGNLFQSVFLSLVTSALWGIAPVLFKNTYSKLPPYFSYVFDGLIGGTVILMPFALLNKDFNIELFFTTLPYTLIYSITYFMYLKSFQYGKAAIVCTVTQTFPIITVILSVIYKYENVNIYKFTSVTLLILLVLLLSYEENRLSKIRLNFKELFAKPWFIYSLITSFGIGFGDFYLNMGIDKMGLGNASFSIYTTQLIFSSFILVFLRKQIKKRIYYIKKHNMKYLTYIVIGSIFMNLGAITLYRAFDIGLASIVSPVSPLSPVFTILFAWAFLKEKVSRNEKILIVAITTLVAYIGT